MEPAADLPKLGRRKRRGALGTAPGTLVSDVEAVETRLNLVVASATDEEHFDDISVEDIARLRGEWPMVWVDCIGLRNVETIAALGQLFGLHRLALEDVVNTGQRPKTDFYDDHGFVVLHMIDDRATYRSEQIAIFFAETFVVTFQERPGDCFDPVRKRLAGSTERIHRRKADYLAYSLIDTIVDSYFPVAEDLGDSMDRIEQDVISRRNRRQMARLHELRRRTVAIKRQLWPMRDALGALMRADVPYLAKDTKLYLNDAHDHAIQLIEMVETYREGIGGLTDMHLSLGQARTSEVINVLTIVSTIFIPLTFLVGVWGMNFNTEASPWNMPELNWYYGYPLALGFMFIVALGLVSFFKWRRWI